MILKSYLFSPQSKLLPHWHSVGGIYHVVYRCQRQHYGFMVSADGLTLFSEANLHDMAMALCHKIQHLLKKMVGKRTTQRSPTASLPVNTVAAAIVGTAAVLIATLPATGPPPVVLPLTAPLVVLSVKPRLWSSHILLHSTDHVHVFHSMEHSMWLRWNHDMHSLVARYRPLLPPKSLPQHLIRD